ncbi:efflux RND transporter periplasmic adaptor subunit [Vibrio tapetis subsp. quintayensis]|uniref:efflux RND transporter periplasmic adaptor subunit n=1 Tax=Vibrio tapetis TaxID=52443 RepID=UPI0025B59D74|nr:efflux RND transporter periplasmic adaptor subunit [Vibrio tapetis]MDN3680947.1 efflux RND transporter periplasmic adaptor subunit [Vibrio tapetis subsp. quintayensis]
MRKVPLYTAIAFLLSGCGGSNERNQQNVAQVTHVSVVNAKAHLHSPTNYYVGRIQAIESAKLTPKTTGYLLKKCFEDGALVEQGDVLFTIDPTSYQAALDAARASMSEAKSALALTELNHQRNENMLKTGGVSQSQFDFSAAELSQAKHRVESAQANLVMQQDNLEQTQVRSPYSGKLGKSLFSIGDMVGPNFGPLIDLIQIHPIEASFSLKQTDVTAHDFSHQGSTLVSLEIAGEVVDSEGVLSFVDNKIDPQSGTIDLAATFNNKQGQLTANQYVRVGLAPTQSLTGVKIPHAAVHQDYKAQYVMTIEDGIAVRRDVEVADRIGQNVFITQGLAMEEPIIIGGLQRIREGAQVVVAE